MVEGKGDYLSAFRLTQKDQDKFTLTTLEHLALMAGAAILDHLKNGIVAKTKADLSPVTLADEHAEHIILKGLAEHFPHIPVVAEEAVAAGNCPEITGTQFFLVDALDGTKEFVAGRNDFTVNIALIENAIPVCGIVYAPAHGLLYSALRSAAFKTTISNGQMGARVALGQSCASEKVKVLASRSHMTDETQNYLDAIPGCEIVNIGSSLKFCMLAEGKAHVYPRFGRTMEWDTAAGDAILRAVGGITRSIDGKPLLYGKCMQENWCKFGNPDFVASVPSSGN